MLNSPLVVETSYSSTSQVALNFCSSNPTTFLRFPVKDIAFPISAEESLASSPSTVQSTSQLALRLNALPLGEQ